jgi:hypothetical protein
MTGDAPDLNSEPEKPDESEKKTATVDPTQKSLFIMTDRVEPTKIEQNPQDDEIFEQKIKPTRHSDNEIIINVIRDNAMVKKWQEDIDDLDGLISNLPPAPRGRFGTASDRMCRSQGTTFNKKRRKGPHILE